MGERRPRYPTTPSLLRLVDRYADRVVLTMKYRANGYYGRASRSADKLVRLREEIVAKLLRRTLMDRRAGRDGLHDTP